MPDYRKRTNQGKNSKDSKNENQSRTQRTPRPSLRDILQNARFNTNPNTDLTRRNYGRDNGRTYEGRNFIPPDTNTYKNSRTHGFYEHGRTPPEGIAGFDQNKWELRYPLEKKNNEQPTRTFSFDGQGRIVVNIGTEKYPQWVVGDSIEEVLEKLEDIQVRNSERNSIINEVKKSLEEKGDSEDLYEQSYRKEQADDNIDEEPTESKDTEPEEYSPSTPESALLDSSEIMKDMDVKFPDEDARDLTTPDPNVVEPEIIEIQDILKDLDIPPALGSEEDEEGWVEITPEKAEYMERLDLMNEELMRAESIMQEEIERQERLFELSEEKAYLQEQLDSLENDSYPDDVPVESAPDDSSESADVQIGDNSESWGIDNGIDMEIDVDAGMDIDVDIDSGIDAGFDFDIDFSGLEGGVD